MGGNRLSKWVYALCVVVISYTSFIYYPRWQQTGYEATITWDVSGYYWYLPSLFIYHDLGGQHFKDSILSKYTPTGDFQQAVQQPNGNYVLKYSSGMAVMYLPWFTAGHLVAGALGYPRDGFSAPYQLAIQLGGLIVGLLGLWLFRKLLLKFYNDTVTAIVLAILVLGTNFWNYCAVDAGMSHTWLFTLYVLLILNTIHFHEAYRTKYAVRIGLIIGLATLTRPTEILACLIPLLWGMESVMPAAIASRIKLLLGQWKMLLLAAACGAPVVLLQFVYWKAVSGHWMVYSYGDQHLYFRSPNFFNYTLSFRSGWLTYTPMMVLAFAGLLPFLRSGKNKVAIATFFLLNYYVVCAWSIWWYGGRAMLQSYPVLMFPIAALIQTALQKRWLAVLLTPVVLVFVYFNIWFLHQSHRGGLYDTDVMTGSYYFAIAGRWQVPPETAILKDGAELYTGRETGTLQLWQNNFETDTAHIDTAYALDGKKSLRLNESTPYAVEYTFPTPGLHKQWLKVSGDFYCEVGESQTWSMAQMLLKAYKNGVVLKENMLRIHRLLPPLQQRHITLYMSLPGNEADSVRVCLWNGYNTKTLHVDNIVVSAFDAANNQ